MNETFDVVLLASFLVNTYQPRMRDAMLAACRRHVAEDGRVIVQRHLPRYFGNGQSERDGMTIRMRDVEYPEPDVVSATLEYRIGDDVWTHSFFERLLDDDALAEHLATAGLVVEEFLDEERTWIKARPI